jgi:hypothetical protein
MHFAKGNKGKPKGAVNKSTKDQRELITQIIDNNIENIQAWIDEVGKSDKKRAFDMVKDLMEFSIPKLKAIDHNFGNSDVTIHVSIKKNESGT